MFPRPPPRALRRPTCFGLTTRATATTSPIKIGSIDARLHVCIGLPSSSVPFERTSGRAPCTRDRMRNAWTGTATYVLDPRYRPGKVCGPATLARQELLPSKAPGRKMPSATLVSPTSSRPMPACSLELPAPSVPHVTVRSPCPIAGDPKVIRGRAKRGDLQAEGWRRDVDDLSGRSPRGPHANSKQNRSNETGT
jgi:hypothetical protein